MSQLRAYLRNKIRYQTSRIRSGLQLRFSREWRPGTVDTNDDPFFGPMTSTSPNRASRHRLHHGIRKGIRTLRRLRALAAELDAILGRSA